MAGMFGGKTLDQFREEQRRLAIAAHEAGRRAETEQRERQRQEAEAARKPPHEEMKDKAARMAATMKQLQPGDPRAAAVLRSCCLELLEIVGYVLEITGQREEEAAG